MKDSFASLCFTGALVTILTLGLIGLKLGSQIPFIPSKSVHVIATFWTPLLMALALIVTLAFHRDIRDPLKRRKLVELYSRQGVVRATIFLIVSATFISAIAWLCGDAGIQKSAVYLTGILPSKNVVVELPIYGIRDFSSRTASLMWVKIDNNGHVDDFSYPKSRLTFLPCPNDRIQVSGSASWAGILVNSVECSKQ